jgi:LPXTG-motif cell wall-anchored protein
MKRLLKMAVAAVVMAAVIVAGAHAPEVSAATTKVVVHVQDGQNWGSMNVYDWGDKGELAGAWPGSAMESEGDGWYVYTFETEVDLNLVFCAAAGTPQSSNIEGLSKDAGEVWVTIGGAGEANDMGAATNEAKLFTEPEEGWPSVAAATEEVAEDTTEETTETAAEEPAAEASEDLPKTGESTVLAIAFIGLAAVSGAMVAVFRKKEQMN